MAPTAQKRWLIAFAAALMNAVQTGAFFFAPTTLMPLIVSDFNLPLSLSTVAIGVGKVAYVLLLVPGGMIVDHFGPRRCVIVGIIGLAFMLTIYTAFVTNFASQIVCHVIMAIFAAISGVPVYSIFIAQWFDSGIGLAMGLVLAGYSAAGTTIPVLLGPVAAVMGWRVAMAVTCSLLWFVGLPVSYFLLHEYHDDELDVDTVDGESQPLLQNTTATPGLMDRPLADQVSWTFVGFAFSYILLQYCFGCFAENILFFLTIDRDVNLGLASVFFSALNLSSFSAKLVGGHLGDRYDRFHVAAAASALASVGIYFVFIAPPGLDDDNVPILTSSLFPVMIFIVLFGFGYGATFNSLYSLTPIVFGKQNLGRTQSALFGLGLCGNAVGSVLTGVLRADYGTYQRPFLIAAVASTANFFVFNVTRLTLGGSMEGLKELQDSQGLRTGRYLGVEELDAEEEAAKLRIGDDTDSEPRQTPIGSPRILSMLFPHAGLSSGPSSMTDLRGQGYATRQHHRWRSGTGMIPEDGYPIVRDWSNSSLRSALRRVDDNEDQASATSAISRSCSRQALRQSSTFEAMIDSGIFSASFEAVGYLGKLDSPRLSNRGTPRAHTPIGSPPARRSLTPSLPAQSQTSSNPLPATSRPITTDDERQDPSGISLERFPGLGYNAT